MKRISLLLAVLSAVLAAACTSTSGPPAAPVVTIPAATVPVSGVAVHNLAGVDPCRLMNTKALARFGEVTVDEGVVFTGCDVSIGLSEGGFARTGVSFDFAPESGAPLTPRKRGRVTVYTRPVDDMWCQRYIVVSAHDTVRVSASVDADPRRSCAIADAVVDGVLPQLARGTSVQSDLPLNSLARQDACKLLDSKQIQDQAGFDVASISPSYGGQACTWLTSDITKGPSMLVGFYRGYPPSVPRYGDREVTIAGHPGVTSTVGGSGAAGNRSDCEIILAYRPLDKHPEQVEQLDVHLATDRTGPESCQAATTLTQNVLSRLPHG